MKSRQQTRLNFSAPNSAPEWAEIIAGDFVRYPSPIMQRCALQALHKAGKPHDGRRCPLCQPKDSAA
jgi:hypothetical protein